MTVSPGEAEMVEGVKIWLVGGVLMRIWLRSEGWGLYYPSSPTSTVWIAARALAVKDKMVVREYIVW
jgi:hypothetical protein